MATPFPIRSMEQDIRDAGYRQHADGSYTLLYRPTMLPGSNKTVA